MCHDASMVCPPGFFHTTWAPGTAQADSPPQRVRDWQKPMPATPAFKGLLSKIVGAAASGKMASELGHYMQRHPDAGTKLKDLLHSWMSPKTTAAPAPASIAESPQHLRQPIVPGAGQVLTGPVHAADQERKGHSASGYDIKKTLSGPWGIAGLALVTAGICAGVAGGALCHAGMGASSARDLTPHLLTGEHGGQELVEGRILTTSDYECAPLGTD